jgi:KUP system potassium uptake protein
MLMWFVVIAVLGLRGIVAAPGILGALSPHHALMYLAHSPPAIGFAVLGAAFLALTGAEAMMPIWAISAACRSASAGSPSSFPLSF